MQVIGAWILGTYIVGLLLSTLVFRVRSGISVMEWGLHMLPKYGIGWTFYSGVKMVIWPAVLVHWLATGRPEPRYVFNEKAARLAAGAAAGSEPGGLGAWKAGGQGSDLGPTTGSGRVTAKVSKRR